MFIVCRAHKINIYIILNYINWINEAKSLEAGETARWIVFIRDGTSYVTALTQKRK